jgi:glycerol-3-phosphate dehydrogenase (NAD(P)+)
VALSLHEAIDGAELIVSCLPMAAVEEVARSLAQLSPGTDVVLVSTTKGLDPRTAQPPSHCWMRCFPDNPLVVLSGPNLAAEIRAGLPTATVVASDDPGAAHRVQDVFTSERFRVYTSADWRGVEMGGVLKNVIALAAGVSDGLALGANAKAALITRGLAEMIRVGEHWGCRARTFYGLSGLGDLATTCYSPLSRNYQVGFALGEGKPLPEILAHLKGTAEGVYSAPILAEYARRVGLDAPITEQVCAVLSGRQSAAAALAALMGRRLKDETE